MEDEAVATKPLSLGGGGAAGAGRGGGGDPESPVRSIPAVDPLSCITSLLASVLSSRTQVSALPSYFCATLLGAAVDDSGEEDHRRIEEGVPGHPLYVHLATALYQWIHSGEFPRSLPPMPGIHEDDSWKAHMGEWSAIVTSFGSEMIQLWSKVSMQLHVQEPYASLLKDGLKTVEGRCATDGYRSLVSGDIILVNEEFLLQVEGTDWYPTFHDMLETEGLAKALPGVESMTEGVKVYRQFYTVQKEQARGVLGIHVSRPKGVKEPPELLSSILNSLGVEGVRALLGMRSTVGTIKDSLPPPKSALISSFSMLNNPNVAGSHITVGARALAKHVPRSSKGWWGSFSGTESEKNELAKSMLKRLMKHAIWMNVHLAPFPTFEIRVSDGYGARWVADGSQFQGFLEPPMDDGYLKKWRH
ncbi:unnamed protein product [Sphagnum jensenii]|uniref:ASCH domain-containing protein n=1 Tax=Sphagnum jensenii TaxID=128206 RepID=A0ABP1A9A0_9BRYO